jgi:hypothetical protein
LEQSLGQRPLRADSVNEPRNGAPCRRCRGSKSKTIGSEFSMSTKQHAAGCESMQKSRNWGEEALKFACPNCLSTNVRPFYEVPQVPVHSCIMCKTKEDALKFPVGDVLLGFCNSCGFISNIVFDSMPQDYNPTYEDQQSFSATFNAFAKTLANRMVEKFDLHGKRVIEIGCGKGDFLVLLCELGGNRGVAIDPTCLAERQEGKAADKITWVQEYYSEKHGVYKGDLICCRHTLEHIHRTQEFVSLVRRSIGDQMNTDIVFELPSATRVFRDIAFEDIYYEHCSYFSPGSLARLFRICGFEVTGLSLEYDDQYLVLEARPAKTNMGKPLPLEETVEEMSSYVDEFTERCRKKLDTWKKTINSLKSQGKRIAIWGSGSKCVAFMTTLGIQKEIENIVDINPHRHGKFIPGVAREVQSPEVFKESRPDVVIVMNSIYLDEISKQTRGMGLQPEFMSV